MEMGRLAKTRFYPEPRGPRVPPVGELVLWYGMFAPSEMLIGNHACLPVGRGFSRGAP
jgi:hypothetical protein